LHWPHRCRPPPSSTVGVKCMQFYLFSCIRISTVLRACVCGCVSVQRLWRPTRATGRATRYRSVLAPAQYGCGKAGLIVTSALPVRCSAETLLRLRCARLPWALSQGLCGGGAPLLFLHDSELGCSR
jgi:hypothetical protein